MAKALQAAEQAILSGDEERLYEALKATGAHNLQAHNKGWYLKQLQADRESKEQVGADGPPAACEEPRPSLSLPTSLLDGFLSLGVSRRSPD